MTVLDTAYWPHFLRMWLCQRFKIIFILINMHFYTSFIHKTSQWNGNGHGGTPYMCLLEKWVLCLDIWITNTFLWYFGYMYDTSAKCPKNSSELHMQPMSSSRKGMFIWTKFIDVNHYSNISNLSHCVKGLDPAYGSRSCKWWLKQRMLSNDHSLRWLNTAVLYWIDCAARGTFWFT